MSDEQDKLKLSLEPPRFGRKKKPAGKAGAAKPAAKPEPAQTKAPADKAPAKKKAPAEKAPARKQAAREAPTAKAAEEKAPEEKAPEEKAAASPAPVEESPTPAAAPEPDVAETTEVTPETETEPETEPEPEPEPSDDGDSSPSPLGRLAKRSPFRRRATPAPEVESAPTEATETDEAEDSPGEPAATQPAVKDFDPDREDAEIAALIAAEQEEEYEPEEPPPPREPRLALYPAAAVTGLVVGAAMVVFTWLSLRGCEAVRDTNSCGGGPGFLLLVATFVVCVLIGRSLLKAFDAPDPGSSSFLAVGAVAAVALFFLIEFLDDWPMIIVIPLLSVGGFLGSAWVTKTFVEPADT